MEHSREELIDILGKVIKKIERFDKNTRKIKGLESQTKTKRFFSLGLYVSLFTLVPFLILTFIESQKSEILTTIFYSVLPALIPGFYFMFGILNFGSLLLFIYGIFSIGRKNSYLYKIAFFRRLKAKIEEKHEKEITELEIENQNIKDSYEISFIPKQYGNLHAIERMREYLVNKRANSLQKAIEVYELELHREEELAIQSAALAAAQRTEEHAKQAETSAKKAEQTANVAAYRRRRY